MPSTTATIAVSASSLAISAGAEDRHVNSSTSNTSPTKDDASTRPTFSHMTYSRAWLKQVALDNCAIAEKGSYVNPENNQVVNITKAFDQAMKGSIHYHSSHTFEPPPDSSRNQYSTTFIIANGSSSMQVASQLLKMQQSNDARDDETNSDDSQANSEDSQKTHIGVLNSASGKTPGGKFFRGTVSQEDQICRSSLLYPCLKQFDDRPHHFYFVNQNPNIATARLHVPFFRHMCPSFDKIPSEPRCWRSPCIRYPFVPSRLPTRLSWDPPSSNKTRKRPSDSFPKHNRRVKATWGFLTNTFPCGIPCMIDCFEY